MGIGGSSPGFQPKAGEPAWPSFLRGEDAQEVFSHLDQADPLRLRERAARRLREVWVLLDPDRVYRRATAVCADAAPREEPPADLDAWAHDKLDLAIDQLVQKDHEAERTAPDILTSEERDFPLLTKNLMVEPRLVRSISVAFNALPPLPRRAFFELMIEGRDVGECIEGGPWDEDGLYDAIQTALSVFGLDARPEPSDDQSGEKGKKA